VFIRALSLVTIQPWSVVSDDRCCSWHGAVDAIRQAALILALCCLVLAAAAPAVAQGNAYAERLERTAALINSDRLREAEQQLNAILKLAPNEAVALNLLGTVRAKQGRLDDAEALFTRSIRSDKELVGAYMNLAYLYLLKGQPERTVLQLREVLRLQPGNVDASYRLAWLLLSLGRFDESISVINTAKQIQPLSIPLLNLLGDAHLKKHDVRNAEEVFLLVLNEQGSNGDALLGLAASAQVRGDAQTASLYLSRAKDVIAESPDLLYKFALVAQNSGLKNEALSALKRAIELRPKEPSYRFVLGLAWLIDPADLQEAEAVFQQFLKLQPGDARGQLYLGYVLLKQKKHAEARAWLEKSIQKETGKPETFYYLALIAQEQNENERAIELLAKAIQLAPSYASAHVALGATYLKLKDYSRAQQAFETAVKLNPDDSKAHYNLALLFARLKNQERAQQEMRIVENLRKAGKSQAIEEDLTPPPPR
jgi:tetratricopeptide (TPR) repeat protein